MQPPPMTPVEEALRNFSKAMVIAKPIFARFPTPSPDMTAQQARMLESVADKLGLVSDCLAAVAILRLKELREAASDD